MDTKTPIYLTFALAIFFAGAAWANYDWLAPQVWVGLACLWAFMLIIFLANHWLTAWALKYPVEVEVRPNLVVIDGVELQIPFSSEHHLFSGRGSMVAVVIRVQDQVLAAQSRLISLRRSAQVLIAPGDRQLAELECRALDEMFRQIFFEPTLWTLGPGASSSLRPVVRAF